MAPFDLPTQPLAKQNKQKQTKKKEIGCPYFHQHGLNAWGSEKKERTRGQAQLLVLSTFQSRDQDRKTLVFMSSALPREMWPTGSGVFKIHIHNSSSLETSLKDIEGEPGCSFQTTPHSLGRKNISSVLYRNPQKENMGSCTNISYSALQKGKY